MNPEKVRADIISALEEVAAGSWSPAPLLKYTDTMTIRRFFGRTGVARVERDGSKVKTDRLTRMLYDMALEQSCGGPVSFNPIYMPMFDLIVMPSKKDFRQKDSLLDPVEAEAHELAHASGHTSRLNRHSLMYGKSTNPPEETVANLGGALLLEHHRLWVAKQSFARFILRDWGDNLDEAKAMVDKYMPEAEKAAQWLLDKARRNPHGVVESPLTRACEVAEVEAEERVTIHHLEPWSAYEKSDRIIELLGEELGFLPEEWARVCKK
ncbi:MAG: hypothetical protein GC129_05175 [Proteobacteria bacterium]|nr:hypothetical protein [Pseudomonadota bacterium]